MDSERKHPTSNPENAPANAERMRGFVGHLLGYFIGMAILVPLNLMTSPERHWFLFPLVGWGAVLSLHAAYVMGFFDFLRGRQ